MSLQQLLVLAWVIFALDLAVFGLMVRELLILDFGPGERGEAEQAFATMLTAAAALWLCLINLVLLISWWRESRTGLWVAVACGAVPVLWAWSVAVQAISEWAAAPQ